MLNSIWFFFLFVFLFSIVGYFSIKYNNEIVKHRYYRIGEVCSISTFRVMHDNLSIIKNKNSKSLFFEFCKILYGPSLGGAIFTRNFHIKNGIITLLIILFSIFMSINFFYYFFFGVTCSDFCCMPSV